MRIFILAFVCLALSSCKDKQPEIYTASSVAITGYDPVAYFTENKPVKGNPKYSFEWKGSSWLFSSEQNRDSFSLNPEKYAPQYGGYCAYGCSRGKKVATDPDAWTIVDGKLYLNKSPQVKELWLKEQKQRIEMADKNWSAIKDE
jgi:YHS domain-containing protein